MSYYFLSNFFLSKILVTLIDLAAIFLAFIVYRDNPKGKANKIYLVVTSFMMSWVTFAYLPRILSEEYYRFGLISLKIAWFVTPLFFSFLYLLTINLVQEENRYKTLTKISLAIGVILALLTGFSNLVIAGYQRDGIVSIIYGSSMIPFLVGILFLTIAILIPLFQGKIIFYDKKIQFFSIGLFIFLILNANFNIFLPMFLRNPRLYFFGDYSTLILLAFTTYAIAKHKLFDIKIVATEILVFSIWIALLSEFFLEETATQRLLGGTIFLLVFTFGIFLIRSVKKEIRQREQIEELAGRLRNVNSILAHDVKGTFAKTRGVLSFLLGGELGPISLQARPLLATIAIDLGRMLDAITNILAAGREMVLATEQFNLKDAVMDVVKEITPEAEAKHLAIQTEIPDLPAEASAQAGNDYTIVADKSQLITHVIKNLLENAVNYNIENGSLTIGLAKKDANTFLFTVKDTGVGITEDDKPNMFKEGGQGKNAMKINVHSSGYGLITAKKTAEAHGGKIWFESAGIFGQGTTFFVELPVVAKVNG